jgi:hypothetical protein
MGESFAHINSAGMSVPAAAEPPFWELEALVAAGHPLDHALEIMIARRGGCNDLAAARLKLTAWAPRPLRDNDPGYWQNLVEAERRA